MENQEVQQDRLEIIKQPNGNIAHYRNGKLYRIEAPVIEFTEEEEDMQAALEHDIRKALSNAKKMTISSNSSDDIENAAEQMVLQLHT